MKSLNDAKPPNKLSVSTKTTAKYFGDVYADKNKLVFSTQKEETEMIMR